MAKKGQKFKKYSPEFKLAVILDMREKHLGYRETMRKYYLELEGKNYAFLQKWDNYKYISTKIIAIP